MRRIPCCQGSTYRSYTLSTPASRIAIAAVISRVAHARTISIWVGGVDVHRRDRIPDNEGRHRRFPYARR